MKWNGYLSAEASLSHSSTHLHHSLSLTHSRTKQEPYELERGKIGESIEEDEGEEEGDIISSSSWTPFTPQPLHGKLKKNHLHFLGNPLIHLFGMVQEKAHVEPSQV